MFLINLRNIEEHNQRKILYSSARSEEKLEKVEAEAKDVLKQPTNGGATANSYLLLTFGPMNCLLLVVTEVSLI